MNESLGDRIARLRKERGFSLTRLDTLSGVSRVHINKIELGLRYPSEHTLKRIERALGVKDGYLFELFEPRSLREYSVERRFWERVEKTQTCWLWIGRKNNKGYGNITVHHEEKRVHRFAYELLIGPIPNNMTIHHKCFNRACVNPEHLELMPLRDNQAKENRKKTEAENNLLKSLGLIK